MREARPFAISTQAIKSRTITKARLFMPSLLVPVAPVELTTFDGLLEAAHGLALVPVLNHVRSFLRPTL